MASSEARPKARAKAQEGTTTIRDDETEAYLAEIAAPILKAAGLNQKHVDFYILSDHRLNAFVAGGQNIFLHTGTIMQDPKDPALLMGVIAHESGHISGGHLSRRQQEASNAMVQQALGYLVGLGAAVAGAPAEAVVAAATGGQQVAMRNYLAYSRSHEQAADQAGVGYLETAGISPRGLLELLNTLTEQNRLALQDADPYTQTHPLSPDRVEFIRNLLKNKPQIDKPTPEDLKEKHRRIVAKLYGFLEEPAATRRTYNDPSDPVHRYARAIADFRDNKLAEALKTMDGLIAQFPNDPYFHEFKGQMLFENGKLEAAQTAYERALALHNSTLMKFNLAMVLIAREKFASATPLLEAVTTAERQNSFAWDRLGVAYGRQNKLGESYWALAHKALLRAEGEDLRTYIARAKAALPEGSRQYKDLQDMEKQLRRIKEE